MSEPQHKQLLDEIADARDGLNQKERVILYCLYRAQKELGGRNVATALLYGRVLEHIDISQKEFQTILSRMAGISGNTDY
ncbi:hypothetical protein [Agaribacterium haliotis]|uniref:hypothetical protein n=1 Tax=Agaribacterium haliotis TaxID=2013869 RepID=UPI000BB54221|nr:hypothetical protein [Agaribacterium haliotis]